MTGNNFSSKMETMDKKGYTPLEIVDKREWREDFFSLFFHSPLLTSSLRSGHFLMVRDPDAPTLLSRPFSMGRLFHDEGVFELFFQVVGKGTESMARKRVGDTLSVLGPLGNPFPLEKQGRILLIAGGRGISPFLSALPVLAESKRDYSLLYGAKTARTLLFRPFLADFPVSYRTDDGSFGQRGLVVDGLSQEVDLVFACGPEKMLERVALFYKDLPTEVYLSLEERMGCGTGICYGCARKVRTDRGVEMVRVCEEGPVFEASRVVWDE